MGTTKLLTVDELLKMSEDDYMDERQLAFFKNRLQTMEAELRANADQTTVNLRETTVVPDPADRATIEEEHALELRTRDRERKLLKKVQAAIKRIDDGEYGYCEETGIPSGSPACWLDRPPRFLSRLSNVANSSRSSTETDVSGSPLGLMHLQSNASMNSAIVVRKMTDDCPSFFVFAARIKGNICQSCGYLIWMTPSLRRRAACSTKFIF